MNDDFSDKIEKAEPGLLAFWLCTFFLNTRILLVSQGATHMPPSFIQRQAQMFLLQGRF